MSKQEEQPVDTSVDDKIYQSSFRPQPTFLEKIIEGHNPVLRTRRNEIKEPPTSAIRVSVSAFRKLFPWYLHQIGRLSPLTESHRSPDSEQSAEIGSWLHKVDNLYRSIIHGNTTEELVKKSFPSMSEEDRLPFEVALRDVDLPQVAGKDEIAQTLVDAYKIFRGQPGWVKATTRGLPGFDMQDAGVKISTIFSDQSHQRALLLAESWAREASNPKNTYWLFRRNARSEGEVRMILNFSDDLKLQLSGQLDCISWIPLAHSRVVTQVQDLKTGWPTEPSPAFEEMIRFESWLMTTLAERYTVAKLGESEVTKRQGNSYVFQPTHIDNKEFNGRTRMDYRVLSRGDDAFTFIHQGFTAEERKYNVDVIQDIDRVIHENELEARKLMSYNVQFDLRRAILKPR
ncbi:MAG: hypothetical protein A2785_00790 [Candidatus Chisholmbacteria bacterium RIFCSPHIGHO2_01_FULL_49_18]|uniref:Uncharacterized protein n=2 Tax=Candidatus Chisholmiibacteriota TaxID=1817900 RepID=A0A1G1VL27_9BACT|nr:MAG: hypothetical protein A2785_00790 [Candidatus Chisholmbacteria bacterium RIFCSPHIGHO2_01_FULL_49_18]OGY22206.1 MAG: hypothetical protein A3A65_04920 [Candidatus Chisholmbacteria bacterium RIFCSPLOWO2_01_FULL_49_14]